MHAQEFTCIVQEVTCIAQIDFTWFIRRRRAFEMHTEIGFFQPVLDSINGRFNAESFTLKPMLQLRWNWKLKNTEYFDADLKRLTVKNNAERARIGPYNKPDVGMASY